MRNIFLICLLIPFIGISQPKNIVNVNRVFPKVDKVLEFEKALATHAQKYHSGDWRWRVFEISTGPDAGGYHITEGPTSWEAIDGRGNLGTEHNNDWNKSVAIHLTDRGSSAYYAFIDSLSTVPIGDYSDKINITHYFPKTGWAGKVYDGIRNLRKAWLAGGETMAGYSSSSSGELQFAVVTRYKQGLKERVSNFRKPMKERYEAINGSDSWDGWLDVQRNYLDNVWSELLNYRADLSSK